MTLFLGLAPHLLLHQSKHWKVQADRERCEGVGAISPGDHRVDEIRLLQCKIMIADLISQISISLPLQTPFRPRSSLTAVSTEMLVTR